MEIKNNLSEKAKVDYDLVLAALDKNDQSAYSKLMGKYKQSVYFMLLKMVNNREDANDLTVETFGKAFENLEKYKPSFAFSTWLFRIATNNCIDFIRKKKILTLSLDKPIGSGKDGEGGQTFDFPEKGNNPEDAMIDDQKKEKLQDLVDQLPSRYRKLVILRFYDELSYDEISTDLGIPLGTVKAQIFRAKQLLNNIVNKTDHNF
ncbi:MAG: RNA polymerase sigma factor (sigma-70 family) [Sphingobacteriales bacterium]|jgi:RNA polymerase sigma factor (sigma-70 family)